MLILGAFLFLFAISSISFDWLRTDLAREIPEDGSNSLYYDDAELEGMTPLELDTTLRRYESVISESFSAKCKYKLSVAYMPLNCRTGQKLYTCTYVTEPVRRVHAFQAIGLLFTN